MNHLLQEVGSVECRLTVLLFSGRFWNDILKLHDILKVNTWKLARSTCPLNRRICATTLSNLFVLKANKNNYCSLMDDYFRLLEYNK